MAEYIADDESQVSFKAGDKVVVMSKDDSGTHSHTLTHTHINLHSQNT